MIVTIQINELELELKVVYSEALSALAYMMLMSSWANIFSQCKNKTYIVAEKVTKSRPTHVEPTNSFPADRWYGCSESLWQVMSITYPLAGYVDCIYTFI